MSTTCPHCASRLNFSGEQEARFGQSLAKLPPGESLKFKCPKCGGIIELTRPAANPAAPATAQSQQSGGSELARPAANPAVPATAQSQPSGSNSGKVQPPPPPPLDWLTTGEVTEQGKVEDVPMALLVCQAGQKRDCIAAPLKGLGYQIVCTENGREAKERMRFVNFSCIVYQTNLHGGLEVSSFHNFMRDMNMERRRSIFYMLTGTELRTLYDLEAMALSANLTVNFRDLAKLHLILRRAFQAHENLFGPYLEELNAHLGI